MVVLTALIVNLYCGMCFSIWTAATIVFVISMIIIDLLVRFMYTLSWKIILEIKVLKHVSL